MQPSAHRHIGLATLRSLRRLLLTYNRITSLAGLVQCHDGQLAHFEAYGNRTALIREAEYLRGLPMFAEVLLRRHGQDNPVCREPGYRDKVLTLLPGLQTLDDESTTGTAPVPDRPGAAYACALEALSQPMPSASAAGVGGAGTATAHSVVKGTAARLRWPRRRWAAPPPCASLQLPQVRRQAAAAVVLVELCRCPRPPPLPPPLCLQQCRHLMRYI
jgi:hypothetical protein